MLKSVREREATVGHVLAAVAAATGRAGPPAHLLLRGAFPPTLHERLLALLPDAAHFEPVAPPRGARGPVGARFRRFALDSPDLDTLPADESRFWANVALAMADPRVPAALAARLAGAGRGGRRAAPWPARENPPAVGARLERTGPGGRIPLLAAAPGERAVALVAVLSDPQGAGGLAADLAAPRGGLAALAGPRRESTPALHENDALALALPPAGGRRAFPALVLPGRRTPDPAALAVLTIVYRWTATAAA